MSQRRATRLVAPPLMKNDHSDGSNIPWLDEPRPVGPGTKHIFWHPTIEESDQRVWVNTNGIQWLNYQDCKICKYYKQFRTNSNQAACLFLRSAATFFRWRTQLWDPDSPCPLLRYHGRISRQYVSWFNSYSTHQIHQVCRPNVFKMNRKSQGSHGGDLFSVLEEMSLAMRRHNLGDVWYLKLV